MTTWLWIIGCVAIIWPVFTCLLLDHRLTIWASELVSHSESRAMAEAKAKETARELAFLQDHVAHQDALIAALWYDRFGLVDDAYDDSLKSSLGVKPDWHPHRPDVFGPVAYLAKYDDYPWGSHAESLYTDR